MSSIQTGALDEFKYDERDALIEARWWSGDLGRFAYDDRGDLAHAAVLKADGSKAEAEYAHDGLHRIRYFARFLETAGPTQAEILDYGYDVAGGCAANAAWEGNAALIASWDGQARR